MRYYNKINSFCPLNDETYLTTELGENGTTEKKNRSQIKIGPDYKSIIIFCVILLLIMVAMGIFWTRQQKQMLKRRNRLYDDY